MLVCAAIGCPPLQDFAFTADKLEAQFDLATRNFLSDRSKNRYDKEEGLIEISSIFDWYEEDFVKKSGSVAAYVAPWLTDDPEFQQQLREDDVEVDHLDYDWSLNSTDQLN